MLNGIQFCIPMLIPKCVLVCQLTVSHFWFHRNVIKGLKPNCLWRRWDGATTIHLTHSLMIQLKQRITDVPEHIWAQKQRSNRIVSHIWSVAPSLAVWSEFCAPGWICRLDDIWWTYNQSEQWNLQQMINSGESVFCRHKTLTLDSCQGCGHQSPSIYP